jgi:hypothetical protein
MIILFSSVVGANFAVNSAVGENASLAVADEPFARD